MIDLIYIDLIYIEPQHDTQTKTCKLCGKTKPVADFPKNRRSCKACYAPIALAIQQRWKQRHPDRVLTHVRRHSLRIAYGMTLEQARAMYDAQGGKCALCLIPLPFDGKLRNIDHDHKTGIVRGIVCPRCNQLWGRLERLSCSPTAWLKRAIAYHKEAIDNPTYRGQS